MAGERPQYFPLHDLLATNITLPQDSDYIQSGYPTGLPVPSKDHNGKLYSAGLWHAYIDCNTLRTDDWLDATIIQALTPNTLTYDTGENVTTTGATVLMRTAYLFEGRRFETDDALLNPLGGAVQASPLIFASPTLPGRLWVYLERSGQVRVESVGPAVADAPGASEMTLIGVQLDGAGVVTDGALAPTTLPLPTYGLTVVAPLIVDAFTATTVTANRFVGLGNGLTLASMSLAASAGAPTLEVTGNGSTTLAQAAITSTGGAGRALRCTATGGVACVAVEHSSAGPGVEVTTTGAGMGVLVDASGGTGTGIDVTATAFALSATCTGGVAVSATTAGGTAVDATATTGTAFAGTATTGTVVSATVSGSGDAVVATGGASAISNAGTFTSTHIDATALLGVTAAGSSSTAVAVRGSAFGDAIAVIGLAVDGYGVYAQSDTTTPKRAAMRLTPQDDDPTTPAQGDLLFNSARGATGKLRTYTTQYESVHSSDKGWVKAWGVAATGGPLAGSTGNISLAQITPEETGDVLVTATGSLLWGSDVDICSVTLVDVTSAVNVATQSERAPDIDGGATRQRSFVIRGIRTLPNTATRTFAVVITLTAGASFEYFNVICSVEGVQ